MRCRGMESSLCLVLAAVATAGCASLPGASSLVPGGAAKANQTLEAQLAMARLSERHGDAPTAEKIYQAVLQKNPQNQLALHRLGVLAAKVGEHDKAAEHLNAAAQLGPPSSELLNDIGFNLFVTGRVPEAEAVFRQAIAVDPQNKAARNNLGLVLGETQRYDESLAEFRRGSSEAEAHANLAYAKTQAGDLAGAKSSYDRALTLNKELKPAAEALVQLARHRPPSNESDLFPAESGRTNSSRAFDRRRMTETASREKTLAELVQEGKTADFLESVTEQDRTTGRSKTFRPPVDAASTIAQVAYIRREGTADPDSVVGLPDMPDVGRRPTAQVPAHPPQRRTAEERARDSSSNRAAATAGAGGSFVLARVFRFPDKVESVAVPKTHRRVTRLHEPAAVANRPDSQRQAGVLPPAELDDAVEVPTAWPTPTPRASQRYPKRNGNLLSSFEPRAAVQPPVPPPATQTNSPVESAHPPETGFAAPGQLLSPTPETASMRPWQTPTWTPDSGGLFSAATPPSATNPNGMPVPTPPLANLAP